MAESWTPILEIGGTHVTAALIESTHWRVSDIHRRPLDSAASAPEILNVLAETAAQLPARSLAPHAKWGVAIPGPFDYARGIGRFQDVAKFDSLNGIDLGQALAQVLPRRPRSITFINDASAYLLGEWRAGAAVGTSACAILTLGTGIGSAFLRGGSIVDDGPDVPPGAEVHLLTYRDKPLEHWVSRRALRRSYAQAVGRQDDELDVRQIAARARDGDFTAIEVFAEAFRTLGVIVAPWLDRFGAEMLVVGGSISRAWDLIVGPLSQGIADGSGGRSTTGRADLVPAADPDHSPLIGAAPAS